MAKPNSSVNCQSPLRMATRVVAVGGVTLWSDTSNRKHRPFSLPLLRLRSASLHMYATAQHQAVKQQQSWSTGIIITLYGKTRSGRGLWSGRGQGGCFGAWSDSRRRGLSQGRSSSLPLPSSSVMTVTKVPTALPTWPAMWNRLPTLLVPEEDNRTIVTLDSANLWPKGQDRYGRTYRAKSKIWLL